MKHAFQIGEATYDVGLSRAKVGYRLHLDQEDHDIEIPINLIPGEEGDWVLTTGNDVDHISLAVDGDDVFIHLDGETYQVSFQHVLERLAQLSDAAGADAIRATMPGSIVSLDVAEGDHVKQGQTILIMESMKMETTIVAPRDGVVESLQLDVGQTFDKDAVLVVMQAEEE